MRRGHFEQLLKLLSNVTVTVNVLRVGQAISEARSDHERIALAQSLGSMLGNNYQPSYNAEEDMYNNGF